MIIGRSRPKRPTGFTLIEMLVTVAIIGIMAAMLFPAVNKARNAGQKAVCTANMRTISAALMTIVADEDGRLPGRGSLYPNGAGASWQDVLNTWAFEKNNRNTSPLQVLGDKPEKGKMYCPSMKPWGTAARYPRAYVMNAYLVPAVKISPNAEAQIPEYNGVYKYDPGIRLSRIKYPSRTVYLMESERNGDYVEPTAPYGQLSLGNGTTSPAWASSNLNWAFRHDKHMNVLFVDGHLDTLDPDAAKAFNQLSSFDPAAQ